jgi:hypothetical protein
VKALRRLFLNDASIFSAIVLVICVVCPSNGLASWDCYRNVHRKAIREAIELAPPELRHILRQNEGSMWTEINHSQFGPPSAKKGYATYYKDILRIARQKDSGLYGEMARELAGITTYIFLKYNPLRASLCDEDKLFGQASVVYGGYKNQPAYSKVDEFYFNDKYRYDAEGEEAKMLQFYNILVNESVNLWITIWKEAGRDISGMPEKNTAVRSMSEKKTGSREIPGTSQGIPAKPAFITVERVAFMPQEYVDKSVTLTNVSLSGSVQGCYEGFSCLGVTGHSARIWNFFVMAPEFARTYMKFVDEDGNYSVNMKVRVRKLKDSFYAKIEELEFVGFGQGNGRIYYEGDRVLETGLGRVIAQREVEKMNRQEVMIREADAQARVQQLLTESMTQNEVERKKEGEEREKLARSAKYEARKDINASQRVTNAPGDGGDIPKLLQKVKAAVVTVVSGNMLGSGFVVSAEGVVITNAHVMTRDSARVRFLNGLDVPARTVKIDRSKDIALLRIEGGGTYPFLPMGDSEKSQEGETVFAVGTPLGLESTVTKGIVSAKRSLPDLNVTCIQTDAAINSGNSGGPLINMRGEAIGINTFVVRKSIAEGLNFAISINDVKNFINRD